jgi:hypothetical protein
VSLIERCDVHAPGTSGRPALIESSDFSIDGLGNSNLA